MPIRKRKVVKIEDVRLMWIGGIRMQPWQIAGKKKKKGKPKGKPPNVVDKSFYKTTWQVGPRVDHYGRPIKSNAAFFLMKYVVLMRLNVGVLERFRSKMDQLDSDAQLNPTRKLLAFLKENHTQQELVSFFKLNFGDSKDMGNPSLSSDTVAATPAKVPTTSDSQPPSHRELDEHIQEMKENFEDRTAAGRNGEVDEGTWSSLKKISFGEECEVLSISALTWRIVCFFLGQRRTTDIHAESSLDDYIISLIKMHILKEFMDSKGYRCDGEIKIDDDSSTIGPVGKNTWDIDGESVSFTNSGFLFFKMQDNENDDVCFQLIPDPSHGLGYIQVYSRSEELSLSILRGLDAYTKEHNILQGKKLRDLNISAGTFASVPVREDHVWEKFYYTDEIKKIFNSDIIGFLEKIDKHVAKHISKRGLLFFGPPGGGKTSLGLLTCQYATDYTVILVTPELIRKNAEAIRSLYKVARYLCPVVIILEDVDLFSEDRQQSHESVHLGALMNVLDGVNSVDRSVTIATTNRLDLVEKALSSRPGRFDRVIEIGAMEDYLRLQMFEDRLVDFTIDEIDLNYLVESTDGMTPASIQEIINSLHIHFISNELDYGKVDITREIIDGVLGIIKKYSCDKNGGKRKKPVGFGSE